MQNLYLRKQRRTSLTIIDLEYIALAFFQVLIDVAVQSKDCTLSVHLLPYDEMFCAFKHKRVSWVCWAIERLTVGDIKPLNSARVLRLNKYVIKLVLICDIGLINLDLGPLTVAI